MESSLPGQSTFGSAGHRAGFDHVRRYFMENAASPALGALLFSHSFRMIGEPQISPGSTARGRLATVVMEAPPGSLRSLHTRPPFRSCKLQDSLSRQHIKKSQHFSTSTGLVTNQVCSARAAGFQLPARRPEQSSRFVERFMRRLT